MSVTPSHSTAEPRNVSQQHKLAKDLLRDANAGDAVALRRLKIVFPDRSSFQLSDAQLTIAREAGFGSWQKLIERAQDNERIESHTLVFRGDVETLRKRLQNSEYLRSTINSPVGEFGAYPLHTAATTRNQKMIDLLLEFGADPNAKTQWLKGPFTVLDSADDATARHLMEKGARLTPHVAARLGWIDELRAMLRDDPSLVHARGGDGKMPLHEAKTVDIVDLLLEHGADLDARCIDHHSTPAMYALMERPQVCTHLLRCGAAADLYQAAQLGDLDLAKKLIDEDPTCLSARVNFEGYSMVPPFSIYCWTIGWYVSPLQLARKAGHIEVAALIESKQDARQRLLDAAWDADESAVDEILARDPSVIERITKQEQGLMAAAAHLNRPQTVRLMLRLGFDVNVRANDGGTTLHQACWIGSAEMVEVLLATKRCLLDDRNDQHQSPPLGWAAYGSVHCGHGPKQYEQVIRQLVAAGADVRQPGNLHGGTIAGMAKGNPTIQKLLVELGAG